MSDEYYAAGYTDSGVKIPLNANSSAMFKGCSGLTSLELSGFNTGSVTRMVEMFKDCNGLVTIYASANFTTDSAVVHRSMFSGCGTRPVHAGRVQFRRAVPSRAKGRLLS